MCRHCNVTVIEYIKMPYWWIQTYGAVEAVILHELWEQARKGGKDFQGFDLEAIKRLLGIVDEQLFKYLQNLDIKDAISFEEENWNIVLVD